MALTRLLCPICGEVVGTISPGAGGREVEPPIVIELRCRNRSKNCSRPLLRWQIRRLGTIERVRAETAPARIGLDRRAAAGVG